MNVLWFGQRYSIASSCRRLGTRHDRAVPPMPVQEVRRARSTRLPDRLVACGTSALEARAYAEDSLGARSERRVALIPSTPHPLIGEATSFPRVPALSSAAHARCR